MDKSDKLDKSEKLDKSDKLDKLGKSYKLGQFAKLNKLDKMDGCYPLLSRVNVKDEDAGIGSSASVVVPSMSMSSQNA